MKVPWADKNSRFTLLFEAHVIDWLRVASTESVRCNLGLSWNAVDRIMQKVVARGLSRRGDLDLSKLGVDEVAFAKRHEYVTVISNHVNQVMHLGDDQTASSLKGFYETLENEQKESIESISMDMWPAYINTTVEHIPDALDKIAFDKFHVMADLNTAVDGVRKQEYRERGATLAVPLMRAHKVEILFHIISHQTLLILRGGAEIVPPLLALQSCAGWRSSRGNQMTLMDELLYV